MQKCFSLSLSCCCSCDFCLQNHGSTHFGFFSFSAHARSMNVLRVCEVREVGRREKHDGKGDKKQENSKGASLCSVVTSLLFLLCHVFDLASVRCSKETISTFTLYFIHLLLGVLELPSLWLYVWYGNSGVVPFRVEVSFCFCLINLLGRNK